MDRESLIVFVLYKSMDNKNDMAHFVRCWTNDYLLTCNNIFVITYTLANWRGVIMSNGDRIASAGAGAGAGETYMHVYVYFKRRKKKSAWGRVTNTWYRREFYVRICGCGFNLHCCGRGEGLISDLQEWHSIRFQSLLFYISNIVLFIFMDRTCYPYYKYIWAHIEFEHRW